MEYQRKQMINLVTSTIIVIILTVVATGQKKENYGYVFGQVTMGLSNGEYGELLPNAIVELKYSDKKITINADEGGGFDEKLRTGKYRLLSVRNEEGKLLVFVDEQNLCFEIKKNKMTRFDIDVMKP